MNKNAIPKTQVDRKEKRLILPSIKHFSTDTFILMRTGENTIQISKLAQVVNEQQPFNPPFFFLSPDATALTMNLIQRKVVLLPGVKDLGLTAILKTSKPCGEQSHHLHLAQSCETAIVERSVTVMSAGRCPCLIDQLEAEHHLLPLLIPAPREMAATLAGRLMGE